jgi:hypothetical protein
VEDDGEAAAEETLWIKQLTSNYGWWQRGNNGANNNSNKNHRQQMSSSRGRGQQWLARGGGHGNEGRGTTIVLQQRRNSFVIRPWRMEVEAGGGCSFFLFLVGLNPTWNPTSQIFFNFL